MLSNTATPRYYGEFRERVLRGEIPVNQEISMEMNRIDDLIANPTVFYDPGPTEGFIAFCEGEMTLTSGEPVEMLFMFKVWAEQVLGWFVYDQRTVYVPGEKGSPGRYEQIRVKRRLTEKQFLIVARGAAKSMYAAYMQAYFLVIDPSTTIQVSVAPTMKQAEEVLSPIRTAINRAPGPLFKFLTQGSVHNTKGSLKAMLASTKMGIQNFMTNSILEIRPYSINKLQGLRAKYVSIDEWLSGDTREDVIGALEQSVKKFRNGVIFAISSEGVVRNGIGDNVKMELDKLKRGEAFNPRVSIWHYKLDSVEEVANPDMWLKANPHVGITVSYDAYQQDVERAEYAPSSRNDILAKRFGIPVEGYSHFFTYEETLPHKEQIYWGQPCSLGIDLSQGDDFCAFSFLFPLSGGRFGVKNISYVTEHTVAMLRPAMRIKYDEFIEEGTLHVMSGKVLDLMEVFDHLDQHIIDNQYDVCAVGYDPYNAAGFIGRWEKENGPFGIVKVPQGARTESAPLGDLKKLSEQRALIFDEKLMSFAMGNAMVLEDTNGNRKLFKARREAKIDNVASTMDAYIAYKANPELFD